jgi:transcriptional regulator with PAS, ATPase and Fis domain
VPTLNDADSPKSPFREIEELRRENAALYKDISALRESVQRLGDVLAEVQSDARRYKALYEALPVSVYVVGHDGIIVGVNPFHLRTMGKGKTTLEDYVGKVAATRPSIVAAGMSYGLGVILRGEPFEALDVHFPALSGGGESWCDVRGVPLVSNGEIVGGIVISMDVTDYHRAKEELRRYAERLEKTLGGFIPICSSCKKIRDDTGSWIRLETYLSARAEVEFTHGLCPECAKKMYSELNPRG